MRHPDPLETGNRQLETGHWQLGNWQLETD
jgi:hypothetical protein